MRVIDLTMPIRPHWRWDVAVERLCTSGPSQPFQISEIRTNVHAFTHVDSPLHAVAGGPSLDRIPVERLAGQAAVIDVSFKGPREAITASDLEAGAAHLQEGDIALLRTCWDTRYSFDSREYWTQACHLTEDAVEWLYERRPSAVGYDFPQDRPLQTLGRHADTHFSGVLRLEDFPTHHLLLARGVLNIEYLVNLHRIRVERPYLFALPILVEGAEAAPARVVAVEF